MLLRDELELIEDGPVATWRHKETGELRYSANPKFRHAHLLAGNVSQAQEAIARSEQLEPGHPTTANMARIIGEVADGSRPQPSTISDITRPAPKRSKKRRLFGR